MDAYKTLLERLKALAASDMLPMHMPGHKRSLLAPYLEELGAKLDVTEIHGFDDLHQPEGILREAQGRAAELWGAEESYFLVNGSSAGILAGLYACTRPGDELLLTRGAHKSIFHAIELGGLLPRFLLPPSLPGGLFGSVSPAEVEAALEKYPKVKLVLLTSPTYEGVLSDVGGIARLCHGRGVLLMVDEAHGAHLGLGGGFPEGAVKAGADLVVQSLHKTLPSLTQTAVLHRNGGLVQPERLRHALAVFQTSSPSYLLMASIDSCVSLLREEPSLLSRWREALTGFDQKTSNLGQIEISFRHGLPPQVFAYDPGKLILTPKSGSGYTLKDALREKFHIELEMAAPGYALAMTGVGDTTGSLDRLAKALRELDGRLPEGEVPPPLPYGHLPEQVLSPGQAAKEDCRFVAPGQAAEQVAAEYVWAYPPGVPLVIPGERITTELAEVTSQRSGLLRSTWNRLPNQVAVVDFHS